MEKTATVTEKFDRTFQPIGVFKVYSDRIIIGEPPRDYKTGFMSSTIRNVSRGNWFAYFSLDMVGNKTALVAVKMVDNPDEADGIINGHAGYTLFYTGITGIFDGKIFEDTQLYDEIYSRINTKGERSGLVGGRGIFAATEFEQGRHCIHTTEDESGHIIGVSIDWYSVPSLK